MTSPNDRLKKALQAERHKIMTDGVQTSSQMPALGSFLNAALANSGRTRADLSSLLDMDPLLVDGILDGLLPDSELHDATLTELAQALDFEPNLLRSIMGRPIQRSARK
jgi:hypothetical protein